MRRSSPEAGSPSVARAGRGRSLWALAVVAGFALFGAVVWLAYQETSPGPPTGEPPLIRALADPIKLPPEEAEEESTVVEGGAVGRLWSDAERADQPERLLPPPEQPLSPEVVTEGTAGAEGSAGAEQTETAAETGQPASAAPDDSTVGESAVATLLPETPAPVEGAHLSEAEAALDRLLAEVAALSEEQSGSTAVQAEAANEPEASAEPSEQTPPAATVAATTSPPPAAPTSPAEPARSASLPREEPPASEAPAVLPIETSPTETAPTETAEIRPASALSRPVAEPAPGEPGATAPDAEEGVVTTPAPAEATQVAAIDDRFRVQLAAVRDEADAQRAWDDLVATLGPVLSAVRPFFERAETADGTFYRVQIGPFATQQPAESLCEELKQHNASCFVIRR